MIINLIKQGLIMHGATEQDTNIIESLKNGEMYSIELKKRRNGNFHRKFFAMLNLGFESWEPPESEYRGLPVQKNFDRFRKDCIIAAGFYDVVSNLKGEIRAEAKSISFGRMSESDFEDLYSKAANVILQRVLTNYTREDLDKVVSEILGFV